MKLKIILLVVISMLYSSSSYAVDEWKTRNTILQGTYIVLHLIDWNQTYMMAKKDWGIEKTDELGRGTFTKYTEVNEILGKAPTPKEVNIYFASSLVIHTAISYILPEGWREAWQGAGIGVQLRVVTKNYNMGMTGSF